MSMFNIINRLCSGMGATFLIFFSTLLISLPLGIIVMQLKFSKNKIISFIMTCLISILRGTPLMLQLIVWFYAPYYLFNVKLSQSYRVVSVILGFSINYSAYFAEIYRSGFISIGSGQFEACEVLGYKKMTAFVRIILPQLIRRVLPAVTNEIITLVKDTSLAFVITYSEMFTIAKQLAASSTSVLPLFVAGVFYYIFNFIVERVMEFFENKLSFFE